MSRIVIIILLFCTGAASAGEIREFDVPTLERLGNELIRVSQQPNRGATDPIRKRTRSVILCL
jgi:hypothetical protein